MPTNNTAKPFVKKFKTDRHCYIYDVHSNEILRVDSIYYDLIDEIYAGDLEKIEKNFKDFYPRNDIREKLSALKQLNKEHNYFLNHKPVISSGFKTADDIRSVYGSNCKQIILELTEACNLRCKYCLYSGSYPLNRHHGMKKMSHNIAEKALNFFLKKTKSNPGKNDFQAITFYGGEPLLRFDMVKHIVELTKEKGVFNHYKFSFTTNGTLLDREIVKYLAENKISILVSLDGPKDMHDKFRVDRGGRGTFHSIINNLKFIQEKFPEYYLNHVSFEAVATPPYNFQAIIDFFSEEELFQPLKGKLRVDVVNSRNTTFFRDQRLEQYKDTLTLELNSLKRRLEESILKGSVDQRSVELNMFFKEFHSIACRPIEPMANVIPPAGSCIPGLRRLFVNTSGKFFICEKVGANYSIGDIDTGFDIERIFEFYREYDKFFSDCGDCWAVRLCNKCFDSIRTGNKFDPERKEKFCRKVLKRTESNLITYCRIREENPEAFSFFEDVKII